VCDWANGRVDTPSIATDDRSTDFNLDGHLDIADGQTVSLGNGDGTFKTAIAASPCLPAHPVVADVNGDCRPDIVAACIFFDGADPGCAGGISVVLNQSR